MNWPSFSISTKSEHHIHQRARIMWSINRLGYRQKDLGFKPQQEQQVFLFFQMSRLALWPTQPLIQWVPEYFHKGKATSACS